MLQIDCVFVPSVCSCRLSQQSPAIPPASQVHMMPAPSPRAASDAQSQSQSLHVQTREDWSRVTSSRDRAESDSHTAIRLLDWLGRSSLYFHSPFDRALTPCRRISNNKHITIFSSYRRTFCPAAAAPTCETPSLADSCGAFHNLPATALLFHRVLERCKTAARCSVCCLIQTETRHLEFISLDGRSSAFGFPPAHQSSRCPTWCPQGGVTRTQGSAAGSRNRTSQPPEAKPPGLRCLIYHQLLQRRIHGSTRQPRQFEQALGG